MKRMKKIVSMLLTLVMVVAMAAPVFAAGDGLDPQPPAAEGTGTLTITNAKKGETYDLYRIFDLKYDSVGEGENKTELFAYTVNEAFVGFFQNADGSFKFSDAVTYDVTNDSLTDADKNGKIPSTASLDAKAIKYVESRTDDIAALATELRTYIMGIEGGSDSAAKEKLESAKIEKNTNDMNDSDTDLQVPEVPYGYYIMVPSDNGGENGISALFSLDTVKPDATINKKGNYPEIDKKINTAPSTTTDEELKEANTAAIGEEVKYVLNSTIPNTSGYKVYYYIVKDTLSDGLTFENDVEISLNWTSENGEEKTEQLTTGNTDSKEDDYTVVMYDAEGGVVSQEAYNAEGGAKSVRSFEIIFRDVVNKRKDDAGKNVKITYSATVNEDAKVGTTGNSNKVTLQYSNHPEQEHKGEGDPDKPGEGEVTGITPEKVTLTYVAGIQINKVGPNGAALTGAKFTISGTTLKTILVISESFTEDENGTYYKLKDGTYTKDDPDSETADKYEEGDKKYKRTTTSKKEEVTQEVSQEATVDETGFLSFEGLGAGSYEITETEAPNGYNKLSNPIKIEIKAVIPNTPDGEVPTDIKDLVITEGKEVCKWMGTYDLQDGEGSKPLEFKTNTSDDDSSTTVHGVLAVKVVNNTGVELPSTGGMGTTIFYVLGSILLIGAGVLLVTKKKMSGRR